MSADTTEAGAGLPKENTDRLLWVEPVPDGQEWYAPSIHVTAQGGIGIDIGGNVVVLPLREWHRLAVAGLRASSIRHSAGEVRYRHKKRGEEVSLIGYGKMQAEYWVTNDFGPNVALPVDMREVAIYRSVDDGSLWVRPREEFEDGRFEAFSTPTPVAPTEPASVTRTRSSSAGEPVALNPMALERAMRKLWDQQEIHYEWNKANVETFTRQASEIIASYLDAAPPSGALETAVTDGAKRLRAFADRLERKEWTSALGTAYSSISTADYDAAKSAFIADLRAALGTKTAEPAVPVSEGEVEAATEDEIEAARDEGHQEGFLEGQESANTAAASLWRMMYRHAMKLGVIDDNLDGYTASELYEALVPALPKTKTKISADGEPLAAAQARAPDQGAAADEDGFHPDDFAAALSPLLSGHEAIVSAGLSNNINVIIAALRRALSTTGGQK